MTAVHESGLFVTGGRGSALPCHSYCCHCCHIVLPLLKLLLLPQTLTVALESHLLLQLLPQLCPPPSLLFSFSVQLEGVKALHCGLGPGKWLRGASVTVTPATVCPEWPHQPTLDVGTLVWLGVKDPLSLSFKWNTQVGRPQMGKIWPKPLQTPPDVTENVKNA